MACSALSTGFSDGWPPSGKQKRKSWKRRRRLTSSQVATPTHGVSSRYVLTGRIDRLEHLVGESPSVAVVLELGVIDEERGELLWLKSYARERAVGSPGIEPAARSLNTAVNEILSELVSDLAAR